jgi:peptide/nickel transport system substrate-binding protein
MRRSVTAAAAIASLAIVLAGCAAPSDAPSEAPGTAQSEAAPGFLAVADPDFGDGGTLSVQIDRDSTEASGLDPHLATTARSWMLLSLVYETLTTVDAAFEVQPGLTSWEQTDETTYVFTLRDGATFSNGRPVTTDDVVGSIERLLEVKSNWAGQLGPIGSIAATGEREVTVELDTPYTPFLAALAHSQASILPMQELTAGEFDPKTETLGSGLLVQSSHVQDQSWTFEPNEQNAAAAELGFDELQVEIVTDEATRLAALRDGSTDLAMLTSPDARDLLAGSDGVDVLYQNNSDFYYLMINARNSGSVTAEPEVRAAINAAIDRQQIIDVALAGEGLPTGVAPANLPGACVPEQLPSAQMPTEEIRQALEQVDEIELLIYDDPMQTQIAQLVQQQLSTYDVTVDIQQFDYGTFSERAFATDPGDFELGMGWFAGYVDATMVAQWWNPEKAVFSRPWMEQDPAFDALLEDAQRLPVGDERDEAIAEMCAAADAASNMVPLATRTTALGYRTDQLSATIQANEGYGNYLRHIVEFRVAE